MKLRVLCTEMILKAYKVMNNIKVALAYLPPKVAIAVLRFTPLISLISVRGYAQKCLRTHRWPLGLVLCDYS